MPLPPPANFSVNIVTDPTNVACFNTLHYYSIDLNSLPIPARDIVAINWTTTGDWVIDPSTPNGSSNSTNIAISNYYNSGVGTLRVEVITRNICLGFGVGTKQVQIIRPPDYGINIVPVTSAPLCVGIPKIYSFIYTLPPGTGTRTGEFFITSTANVLVIPIPTGIKVVATDNGPTSISIEIKHFSACSGSNSGIGTLLGVAGTPTYQNFIANNPRFPLIYDACVQPPPSIQFANATSVTLDGDTSPTTTGIINLPSAAGTYIVSASNSCGNTPNLTVYVVEISSCKTMPEIKISPNPANTYLDVANILAGSEVKIYTKMGVLVHSEKSENDKIRLDISKLNTDLYILEAVLPDKVKVRKQIIKE